MRCRGQGVYSPTSEEQKIAVWGVGEGGGAPDEVGLSVQGAQGRTKLTHRARIHLISETRTKISCSEPRERGEGRAGGGPSKRGRRILLLLLHHHDHHHQQHILYQHHHLRTGTGTKRAPPAA